MESSAQRLRDFAIRFAFAAVLSACLLCPRFLQAQSVQTANALSIALKGTQASGVVLDMRTGGVLGELGPERRATTGSATKPFFLEYGLEHGVVTANTEVYCRRDLRVGGRELRCSHPANMPVFTAETALAESCNTWFAELGRRYSGAGLEAAMTEAGLHHAAVASAEMEQRELAVLGVRGVDATPLELAKAYQKLLGKIAANGPVARGMKGSVEYGMANPAKVSGMTILGKTGTASTPGEIWTHGWFAGALPGRLVVVIYVPNGDGGIAAGLAQKFFKALPVVAR